MIEKEDILPMGFLAMRPFTGSFRGMRFRLSKEADEAGEASLLCVIWPQPFNFEKTAEEEKTRRSFPFSEEGRLEAVRWLNGEYEAKRERWEKAGL